MQNTSMEQHLKNFVSRWQTCSFCTSSASLYSSCMVARLQNDDGHLIFYDTIKILLERNDFKTPHSDYSTILQCICMINTLILYIFFADYSDFSKTIEYSDFLKTKNKLKQLLKDVLPILKNAKKNDFHTLLNEYCFVGNWIILPCEIEILIKWLNIIKKVNENEYLFGKQIWRYFNKLEILTKALSKYYHIPNFGHLLNDKPFDVLQKYSYFGEVVLPLLENSKETQQNFMEVCRQTFEKHHTVGACVEATAKYYEYSKDKMVLQRLMQIQHNTEGLFPEFVDCQTFESSWILFYFLRAGIDINSYIDLEYIKQVYANGALENKGICGLMAICADSDTTSLVMYTSQKLRLECSFDTDIFQQWFNQETDSYDSYVSKNRQLKYHISTNVHILFCFLANKNINVEEKQRRWNNTIDKLEVMCQCYFDAVQNKQPCAVQECWHRSFLYPLSDIVYLITCEQHSEYLLRHKTNLHKKIVQFFCSIQNTTDGGFADSLFKHDSTLEETSFVILALVDYLKYYQQRDKKKNNDMIKITLEKAMQFLETDPHKETNQYFPLWVAKVLYYPVHLVEGIIVSALYSGKQYL